MFRFFAYQKKKKNNSLLWSDNNDDYDDDVVVRLYSDSKMNSSFKIFSLSHTHNYLIAIEFAIKMSQFFPSIPQYKTLLMRFLIDEERERFVEFFFGQRIGKFVEIPIEIAPRQFIGLEFYSKYRTDIVEKLRLRKIFDYFFPHLV